MSESLAISNDLESRKRILAAISWNTSLSCEESDANTADPTGKLESKVLAAGSLATSLRNSSAAGWLVIAVPMPIA